MTESIVAVNGRPVAAGEPAISPLDRGLTLGDGIFETMLAVGRRVFRLQAHLARLNVAAAAIRLPSVDAAALGAAIREILPDDDRPRIVRLTVSRGVDRGRGVLISPGEPTVVVRATPAPPPDPAAFARGAAVEISPIRRNQTSVTARHKTLNYLDNVLARDDARQRGADDAILLNTAGDVACATTANLFAVVGGGLRTPVLACGVLAGITREAVLALAAAAAGLSATEERFAAADLFSADEVFLTNSVLGVLPVTAIAGRPIGGGRPGPTTARLADAYRQLVRAELAAPDLALNPLPLEPGHAHR